MTIISLFPPKSPLSIILLYPVKKLFSLNQNINMHRSSTITSENSPKQFYTNMSVDFDVRGQRETFSMEEALLWPEGEIDKKKKTSCILQKAICFCSSCYFKKGSNTNESQ